MVTRILVIADDCTCLFIRESLQSPEIIVDSCAGPPDEKPSDLPCDYDLLITEIHLARRNSFRKLREILPKVPLILLSPSGARETAAEVTRWGAWDHLHGPYSPEALQTAVKYILQVQDVYRRRAEGPGPASPDQALFIGTSPTMMAFYRRVARVADSATSVLIEGESGTGKELTARTLHQLSGRRNKPFLAVHCGAIPETLLESELFGYERGAFTGADRTRPGLIETAQDGTLLLDEITEMGPSLQGKLLRFMQNGEVRRLGGRQVRHTTVRVVASTNRDLDQEIQTHRFRADLMFRFIVRLKTPPLREHKEDLPQLVHALLRQIALPDIRVSPEAMALLHAYDWPGNIRELENVLHQTYLLSPYPVIRPEHLPERFHFLPVTQPSVFTPLQAAERNQIMQTIQNQGWNRSRTARILGIDRKTLRLKMHLYGLEKE